MARGLVLDLTPEQVVARALAACEHATDPAQRIRYFVGQGGKDPSAPTCASFRPGSKVPESDCVGLALWAYGVDRYAKDVLGVMTWWNQNRIWHEANVEKAHRPIAALWRFCEPRPGCLALIRGPIPGDKRIGHIGVITRQSVTGDWLTAHCSPGNVRRRGQAIGETTIATAFGNSRQIYFVERA